MKTRCPECQTTFRVTPDQLRARAGKVRCGQCQTVFNALDSLIEEHLPTGSDLPAMPPETSAAAQVELVAPIDFSPPPPASGLEAADQLEPMTPASTPEEDDPVDPANAPTDADENADDDTGEDADADNEPGVPATDPALSVLLEPTFSATGTADSRREPSEQGAEPAVDDDPVTPLSEAEAHELGKATGLILPREMTEVPGYSKWSAGVMAAPVHPEAPLPMRWPYIVVATLLAFALLGQVSYRFRTELAINVPLLRPALEKMSASLGTTIPLARRVDLISIESSDLQSDAARGNMLVLSATVRNRAAFPQAYPALELALTDTRDTPIARRVFLPEEYLPATQPADQPIGPHADVGVRIWIEAKDINAAGYRLYVFYP
ncbi:DUF3426 domain-containing protein [uncultured Propionivibrio sp.]|uniref:DUF3426 domain-containing protein n=1 Tax=uncultured Propionivibrio sp. TaxID=426737 RepID=UPI0029C0395C|nr:DUF3426 domain-containing protein [uncultured Propionivibrio sp.]